MLVFNKKMKKMKKYVLILASVLMFISCDKELDKTPYASLTEEELISSPENFTSAVRGLYTGFIGRDRDMYNDYYGSDMFSVPDILTDNVIINQNGRQSKRTLFNWLYNASSYSGFDLYADAYKIVRRANFIIANSDKLQDGDFKNDILGQAYAARALAHFDLVRTYAPIPTQSATANAALGVAYVKTVDLSQKPSRNTVAEVYTEVINDLTTAESLISNTSSNSRFSKNSINALLSRVYLYNGEYQKSIDAANNVTGTVCSRDNFANLWVDESDQGILLQFLIRIKDDRAIGTEYSQTNGNTGAVRSEYVVSYDFYQLFGSTDIRTSTYISTSAFSGISYNHVAKYFGKKGQVNNIVNAKVLRMAEVMLNKAEAYTKLPTPNDAAALVALDAVRSQRYSGFTSGGETGDALKKAIALEKRLEFAFESHRFYDLKRNNQGVTRSDAFGDVADGTGTPAPFRVLEAGDHRFSMPIPLDAMNANSNLVQNPGY